jgi:hypothetical protein
MLGDRIGNVQRSDGRVMPQLLGQNDKGEPVVLLVGSATSDATILTEIGADANYGDGSLYSSNLYQKRNDVWTAV